MYKWKPSEEQRRAFAERMKNPDEQACYDKRKQERQNKRRKTSGFDYPTAGGLFSPTKFQHDFCMENAHLFYTDEQEVARNQVLYGWVCSEKVSHDSIHIVNEILRGARKNKLAE